MRKIVLMSTLCLMLSSCKEDAKEAWSAVLKQCARSDLNSKTILYFGPANNIGPGSIWRPGSDGGYRLRYDLADMPSPRDFITRGTETTCAGDSETKFSSKADIGITTSLTPVSADVVNDFKKAKSVKVKVGSLTWDTVREGPFETYIKQLPPTSSIRVDISKGDRLVIYRALRVSNYSAVMEFSKEDAASLKGKYSGNLGGAVLGDVGANLSATWSSDTNLTITSVGDFYIAGELARYSTTGFSSAGSTLGDKAVQINPDAKVERDPRDPAS